MNEARLERTAYGLTPAEDGWFVVGVRDAAWMTNEYFGEACVIEGEAVSFPQITSFIPANRTGSTTTSPTRRTFSCWPASASRSSKARSGA